MIAKGAVRGTVHDMETETLASLLDRHRRTVSFENRMLALFTERCWATLGRQVGCADARSEVIGSIRSELSALADGCATLSWLELAERLVGVHGVASAVSESGVVDDEWWWVDGAIENLRLWLEASPETVVEWTDTECTAWRVRLPSLLAAVARDIDDQPGEATSELVCCAATAVALVATD